MRTLPLAALVASALALSACSVDAPSDDPQKAKSADTGWLGDTSYELGATVTSTVKQRAEGEYADLATSEDLQLQLLDAQWKFAKNALSAAGYHLNQLADTVKIVSKRVEGGTVTIEYQAQVDLLHELDRPEPPTLDQIATKRFALKLPLEPSGAYARADGKCHKDDDGGPSGDYNLYYYFDAERAGCPLAMHTASLTIDKVYERKTVYPEYDQLLGELGGGKAGFRAALLPAEGDDDRMSRFDAHRQMLERDLRLTGKRVEGDKILRFAYGRGSVAIEIDLFDPTKIDFTPTFRAALGKYQLVFFNGHSRYGTRDYLTDEAAFSKSYQIVMMHSCRSYPYYTRQVFRAKASDADPTGWAGADVVATGESSYPTDSPRTLKPLLIGLLDGMVAASEGNARQAPSWLAIVKKMNDATFGIMYGVAGVRTNRWAPR
jgi:hypothetical protein